MSFQTNRVVQFRDQIYLLWEGKIYRYNESRGRALDTHLGQLASALLDEEGHGPWEPVALPIGLSVVNEGLHIDNV